MSTNPISYFLLFVVGIDFPSGLVHLLFIPYVADGFNSNSETVFDFRPFNNAKCSTFECQPNLSHSKYAGTGDTGI